MEEKKRVARQEGGPLQCPRCGSINTKFCYYNNYNTAQPRHFCRDCHRYWTQGGALRNIPAPGETANRKRNRRSNTSNTPPTAPGPSKVPRIRADQVPSTAAAMMTGSALAALGMSSAPPPPPPMLFGEGIGMVGTRFPHRPTLSLFNQGLAGLRGFQPFNPLMMPPPPTQSLPLPLLHGLSMNQVLSVNAGEGLGANGVADDNAGEGGNGQDGNINSGDSFVNQFFTRFSDGEGGDARVSEFNVGSDGSSNQTTGVASTGTVTGTTDAPHPPASFI